MHITLSFETLHEQESFFWGGRGATAQDARVQDKACDDRKRKRRDETPSEIGSNTEELIPEKEPREVDQRVES